MARSKGPTNGKLEDALATLIQNQAAFVARMSEADQRFARIEAILTDHGRLLAHLAHVIQELPEAMRDKFGFRMPEKAKTE